MIELQIKSSFEQMCLEWAFKKTIDRFAVSDIPWYSIPVLRGSFAKCSITNDTSLVLRSTNNRLSWASDLSLPGLSCTVIKLHMYSVALLWRTLKVSRNILKSILTWSQWKLVLYGQTCEYLWVICQPNFVHIEAL